MRFLLHFVRINRREIQFITLFILFFLSGYFIINFHQSFLRLHYNKICNIAVCNSITQHVIQPLEKYLFGTASSSGMNVVIVQGCDGLEGLILILAAVCAYPLSIHQKLMGILSGTSVIYIANIFRILFLDYIVTYRPSLFDFFHTIVGQTFIIVIGVSFFILWISYFKSNSIQKQDANPLV